MTVWRGPRYVWRGFKRHRVAGLATLGVLAVGAYSFYPYGYVALGAPACTGTTDDGCRLTWRDVPLEDGGSEPQCVQWCPQNYAPPPVDAMDAPPPAMAAMTAPPPTYAAPPPVDPAPAPVAEPAALVAPAVNNCAVTAFADPQMQGNSFSTSESFPALDQWKGQIGSLKVAAGTWDFYSDENFSGEVLRLNPGEYAELGNDWSYAIGSFMCVAQ